MSAYSRPLLVSAAGEAQALDPVPLTGDEAKASYDEYWLQNLLFRYPQALPIEEIDASVRELVPLCREMTAGKGRVDVVYVTRDGRPVIVEAKLWRNPEARRKVVGQILDYARELATWDADDFATEVKLARERQKEPPPHGLLERLGIDKNSPDARRFYDALTKSLKRGELLLLIAGDGIRDSAGAITSFLEGYGTLQFTFGLVEIAIHRAPGGYLVQPRVQTQSDIVKRFVVDLRNGKVDEAAGSDFEEQDTPEENERAKALNNFWRAFLADLHLDRADQPIGSPASGGNQFFRMPTGQSAWISAYVARSVDEAGVYIGFAKGAIGERLYLAMLDERRVIEQELGLLSEWRHNARQIEIVTSEKFPGPLLDVSAEVVRRRLQDWTNRYVNVFRPRLEALSKGLG